MNSIKYLMILVIAMFSVSCGTAKTQYIETKYEICMKKCDLQYSKYDPIKKTSCKASCVKDKYDN